MKVLVVDDEILVRKGISMGLNWEKLGFHDVKEASNGLEALEYCKLHYPELVITDIKMPKMDGLELIENLKKYCPDTVVIVLSCINDTDYVRKAMMFGGAVDYIPKLSLSTDELSDIIDRCKKHIKKSGTDDHPNAIDISKTIYFTKELKQALTDALECSDMRKVKHLLNTLFDQLDKDKVPVKEFIEWHELLSIFSGQAKDNGGNINDIKIDKKIPFDFVGDSRNLYEMKDRFIVFLDDYSRHMKTIRIKKYGVEIEKTIQYVHQHYNENIKLNDVAGYIGINENYLCKLFKKETGVNFIDYINKIKINKAKNLLMEGKHPIYLIAEMVGYNSESYFSRIFKKIEGISPKVYQKNNMEE